MALVSTNRVESVYDPRGQEVLHLAFRFAGYPVVDPDARLIRCAHEVHSHHACPIVFGQHVEKLRQEWITLLAPDRVGDVQAEILAGFTRGIGSSRWPLPSRSKDPVQGVERGMKAALREACGEEWLPSGAVFRPGLRRRSWPRPGRC